MSKIRTAAAGAVFIAGLALSAGAQTPAPQDGGRGVREGEVRRERVERQRRGGKHGERGMRGRRGHAGERRMREARAARMGRDGMARGARVRGAARERLAELNLTEAQRTRIRAIHEKYQPQYRTLREQTTTRMRDLRASGQQRDTSAAARQRLMQEREQLRTRFDAIRRQEQAEVRTVFTAEQRAKVDSARNERAKRLEDQARRLQEEARQLRSIR